MRHRNPAESAIPQPCGGSYAGPGAIPKFNREFPAITAPPSYASRGGPETFNRYAIGVRAWGSNPSFARTPMAWRLNENVLLLPRGHGSATSSPAIAYPRPRTVLMIDSVRPLSSLPRKRLTWTSITFVVPSQLKPQTCSHSILRVTT